jgi:hypothetical protein
MGFSFEDSCEGGHFYALSPLVTSAHVDMLLLFLDFISLCWPALIACTVLQHKYSSLMVELHTKF